jgi:hypothetical protein
MARTLLSFIILLIASCSPKKNTVDFEWLIGTWSINTPKNKMFETWERLNDSTFKGFTVMIINDDTAYTESIAIEKRSDAWYYIPTVSNQNNNLPVEFKLVSTEDGKFAFENPQHDFPQRIIYSNPHSDSLHASIEGMHQGQFRQEQFTMVREKAMQEPGY